jgi:hypothetical protein
MTLRDLKYKIKPVCEYAMLEGKNTDWCSVIESIGIIETEWDFTNGFDFFEDEEFTDLVKDLLEAVEVAYALGDSEEQRVFRLYLIGQIYNKVIKWNTIGCGK